MRIVLALTLIAAAATNAHAGIGLAFSSVSNFHSLTAAEPLELSPASFSLTWAPAFAFHLDNITPASVDGAHTITSANAADFGINWQALHDAVDQPLSSVNVATTRSLVTPLDTLLPASNIAGGRTYTRRNPTLSHVLYTVSRFGIAPPSTPPNPLDAGVFVGIEVQVYVTTFAVPEPASLSLLIPCAGWLLVRRRHSSCSS